MLDLTISNKSFMLVKMPNGEEIRVLPPKRKLMAVLMKLENIDDLDKIYDVVALILSNNRDEKVYSSQAVDDFDIGDLRSVLTSYIAFVGEIQKN